MLLPVLVLLPPFALSEHIHIVIEIGRTDAPCLVNEEGRYAEAEKYEGADEARHLEGVDRPATVARNMELELRPEARGLHGEGLLNRLLELNIPEAGPHPLGRARGNDGVQNQENSRCQGHIGGNYARVCPNPRKRTGQYVCTSL